MANFKGYVYILDFGTVKKIKDRTFIIISTPNYMAPEMTKDEGNSFQIYICSLDICIYEFFLWKINIKRRI